MIAGLLQNTHNNSIDKTPGVGDVPILGALFRSNAFQRNETELVIVITPYLVKPVDANSIVLPTDGYKAPTDAEPRVAGRTGQRQVRRRPAQADAWRRRVDRGPGAGCDRCARRNCRCRCRACRLRRRKATNKISKPKKGAATAMPGFSGN